MTEDERKVRNAQEQQRRSNFMLMLSTLDSIRQEAVDYAETFRKTYKIYPKCFVQKRYENEYSFLPHLDYDISFRVSSMLEFHISSKIELTEYNDLVYVVSVYLHLADENNEDSVLSGNIFIHTGNVENYVDSMKQALDTCYKKYIELHEHLRNRFF